MDNNKALILVANDDGYQSKGFNSLLDFIGDMGTVVACAPDGPRSGYSMAFSTFTPLRLKQQWQRGNVAVWSCNGTPTDCVKVALAELCGRVPDILIGGINHGDNGSVNSHYSGTMGIVMEGCMKHIPSVAYSLCDYRDDADFEPLRDIIRKVTSCVLDSGIPDGVCLNVNFPLQKTFNGVRICRMAHGTWDREVVKVAHPRGYDYYWLTGEYTNEEPEADDTDNWALTHGYVAITPTSIDVTAHEAIPYLKGWKI